MNSSEPDKAKESHGSHWNYRIVEHWDPVPKSLIETVGTPYQKWYGIHEVYYDDLGVDKSYSKDAIALTGECPEDIQRDLGLMQEAFNKPIITGKFDSREKMIKQVIVIRKDLKMRRGKEIAQGSHASIAFLTHLIREGNQEVIDGKCYLRIPHPSDAQMEWINGSFTKVCLIVNSATELAELYGEALEADIEAHIIEDSGRTEFHDVPTMTCLSIGPDDVEKIDAITGHLKLY